MKDKLKSSLKTTHRLLKLDWTGRISQTNPSTLILKLQKDY